MLQSLPLSFTKMAVPEFLMVVFNNVHIIGTILVTFPSFHVVLDPCQPCLVLETLHLGKHPPKTASGPTNLSALFQEVLKSTKRTL